MKRATSNIGCPAAMQKLAYVCPERVEFQLPRGEGGCGNAMDSHDCVANTFGNLLHFGVTVSAEHRSVLGRRGRTGRQLRRRRTLSLRTPQRGTAAINLLFGAKLLRDNPYPVNIAEHNATMMRRNAVKEEAMKLAIDYMRANMPD